MSEKVKAVLGKVKGVINKLPFENLVKKIPALEKFAGYANYAFCVLVILVIGAFASGGNKGVGPAVKELMKTNDEASRYWANFIQANGINAIDSDGDILIVVAAKSNNLPLVKACVQSGADVNLYYQKDKKTALDYVIGNNNYDMVKYLLKQKAVIACDDFDSMQRCLYRNTNDDIIDLLFDNLPKSYFDWTKKKESFFRSPGMFWISYGEDKGYCYNILLKLYKNNYKPCGDDIGYLLQFFSDDKTKNETLFQIFKDWMKVAPAEVAASSVYDISKTEKAENDMQFQMFKMAISNCKNLSTCQQAVDDNLKTSIYKENTTTIKIGQDKIKEIIPILKKNNFDFSQSELLYELYSVLPGYIDKIHGYDRDIDANQGNDNYVAYYQEWKNQTLVEISENIDMEFAKYLISEGFAFYSKYHGNYAKEIETAYKEYMENYYNK